MRIIARMCRFCKSEFSRVDAGALLSRPAAAAFLRGCKRAAPLALPWVGDPSHPPASDTCRFPPHDILLRKCERALPLALPTEGVARPQTPCN